MNFRDAIKAVFGRIKNLVTSTWREVGSYVARFTPYGVDLYKNEIVRACVRTLAEHTSKANVRVLRDGGPGDTRLERLIQYRPNLYMNGKDFLYKCRTLLELHNTLFVYINRDDMGRCIGLYPVPQCYSDAVDVNGELFIKFYLPRGDILTASWEDLAVLRKDYNTSDIWGDDNSAILTSLDLLHTTNEGMANAIKSTANLRGILKSTKAMLSPDDAKRQKEQFVSDYLDIANTSGVVSIDATQEYTPITLAPQVANYKSIEELRINIQRYYGTSEEMILGKATENDREAFYEDRVETFLIAFGLELSNKIFTSTQRSFRNEVIFESNRMQYMSMRSKLALVAMVDRKAMTPNEWRAVMNLAPVPWGDEPVSWQNPKNEGGKANADQGGAGISGNEPAAPDDTETT